ncbi:MAG TPA: DUF922 domain-containing protein [Candidatus Elarobacter sp.]|nr:DUF922 domain-containing protein [Candidatus Elarobacter sp.]
MTTNVLFGAVLMATALAAGSDDEVVQRLHVRYETYDLVAKSCRDVVAHDPESGSATFQFRYEVTGDRFLAPHKYSGKLTFSLGEVVIHLPRTISWPGMSITDRGRAATLRRAIEHHEIGHVRIAEAVRDALNAEATPVEPDVFAFGAAAHAQGRDGFERFKREEREYDALTDHGRKQHLAPGDLAGPDTILICGTI